MKRTTDETALMVRYLLGDVSDEEQVQIEEQFFADDESYQLLVALEDELRYDYAQGHLSPKQRQLFEKRFLSAPAERQKVELANAVLQKAREAARVNIELAPTRSWGQILMDFVSLRPVSLVSATVAASAAICAIAFLTQTLDLRKELNQLQNRHVADQKAAEIAMNQQKTRDEALSRELQQERSRREQLEQDAATKKTLSPPSILAFALGPGLLRDTEGPKRLRIPEGVESVRMQLTVKPAERSYEFRAALENLDGEELWSQLAKATGASFVLTLPARLLTQGDYVIELHNTAAGTESARDTQYYFTVVQ